jgi:hypothetical protein
LRAKYLTQTSIVSNISNQQEITSVYSDVIVSILLVILAFLHIDHASLLKSKKDSNFIAVLCCFFVIGIVMPSAFTVIAKILKFV